ncbi:MAG: DUF3122 domain-containing protein [Cyanobacteria bacterium P01_D01_bin.44]
MSDALQGRGYAALFCNLGEDRRDIPIIPAKTLLFWRKIICSVVVCTVGFLATLSPALALEGKALTIATPLSLASLHTYHEQPGQTTFRSRLSLRDRNDRAWQTILFKRYQGETLEGIYLRLVGFPGLAELDPQAVITVVTGTNIQWLAPPQLDLQTKQLPSNVNQYNFQSIITELTSDIPLEIKVTLQGERKATIVVPPFVVHEWRELAFLAS